MDGAGWGGWWVLDMIRCLRNDDESLYVSCQAIKSTLKDCGQDAVDSDMIHRPLTEWVVGLGWVGLCVYCLFNFRMLYGSARECHYYIFFLLGNWQHLACRVILVRRQKSQYY